MRSGVITALGLAAIALGGAFVVHQSGRDARHIAGTVETADWRLNDETGHVYPFIEVRLEDGSAVRVGNAAPVLPAIGDRITLRERGMLFDTMTVYEWDGPEQGEVQRATYTQASAP
ncbi:hypothetical protein [Hyphomicrobium sp. CS1GBMeth3]|uniref:hypothetical protein n=1 Tax=Hyphomicrobium sp. CS1GBMeth3 TaxID=1892845 RepID=UPI0009316C99|nr:hypothetical protein [Hyphomicrobium sp. CS1GBMeth3]